MPAGASSRTSRAPYHASSAGSSLTTETSASSPSQPASQTLTPSGETRLASPLAMSTTQALRHASLASEVSISGNQSGRSCSRPWPTVPDPRPSACSAASPAMTRASRVPSGDTRRCSAMPGGETSSRRCVASSVASAAAPSSAESMVAIHGVIRCGWPWSARKAIAWPPGSHRGDPALPSAAVRDRCVDASRSNSQSSVRPSPSSVSAIRHRAANRRPSGESSTSGKLDGCSRPGSSIARTRSPISR